MRHGESYYYYLEGVEEVPVSELLGKTVTSLEVWGNMEELRFFCSDHTVYFMYHEQGCCESVQIEDICGELEYLLDSPILMAEEVAGESGMNEDSLTHYTWTFYKFATCKGYVTLRWLGTSNGYYGEEVSLIRVPPENLTKEGLIRETLQEYEPDGNRDTIRCRIDPEEYGRYHTEMDLPAWVEPYGLPVKIVVSIDAALMEGFQTLNPEERVRKYLENVYLPQAAGIVIEDGRLREELIKRLSECSWKTRIRQL